MKRKTEPSEPPYIVDLETVRDDLCAPTWLASQLTEIAGAELLAVRPGHVRAVLPSGESVVITVRAINIFRGEARAYRRAGLPVPPRVLEDIQRWDCEHGYRRDEKGPADD